MTSLVQFGVLLSISALLFGLKLPASAALWLRFAWLFLLGIAAGTVLGIAYSSIPRSSRSAGAVVSPVVIVLQFITASSSSTPSCRRRCSTSARSSR